ncbi:MAG: glycosyltransferase family 39 protein [Nitrospirota bacterium]
MAESPPILLSRKPSDGVWEIAAVGAVALILRLWGIGFGLPEGYHQDEAYTMMMAADFSRGALRPEGIYPPFFQYILGLVFFLAERIAGGVSAILGPVRPSTVPVFGHETYLLLARATSAVAGAGTVVIVYRLGRRLMDRAGAAAAAILLALSPLHVRDSHFAMPDTTMVFWSALFVLAAAAAMEKRSGGSYALMGFFLGLATQTKYNAVFLYVVAWAAHAAAARGEGLPIRRFLWDRRLLFLHAGLAAGLFAGSPYLFLEWRRLGPIMLTVPSVLMRGSLRESAETVELTYVNPENWRAGFESTLAALGWTGIVAGAIGVVWILWTRNRRLSAILSFVPVYFVIVAVAVRHFRIRDTLPLLPFVALAAGAGAGTLARRGRIGWAAYGILLMVAVFELGRPTLLMDYLFWQRDNRQVAADWIRRNLPIGATIGFDRYNPPVTGELYGIEKNLADVGLDEARKRAEYYVTSSFWYMRYLFAPEHHPESRFYRDLESKAVLLKTFDLPATGWTNPKIQIYALRNSKGAVPGRGPWIPRPSAGPQNASDVVFLDGSIYETSSLGGHAGPDRPFERVLVSRGPIESVLVILRNGERPNSVRIESGLARDRLVLRSGEIRHFLVRPRRPLPVWGSLRDDDLLSAEFLRKPAKEPYERFVSRVRIVAHAEVSVELAADAFEIGSRLLEGGLARDAIPFLDAVGARRHPEAKWLLAVAYSRAGESEKAARLFDAVPMWAGEAGAAYRRIVQAGDGSEIWKSAFASTWGVDPDLFLATRTVRYRAADLHSLEGSGEVLGSVRRFDPVRDKPGFLLFGPYDYYPRGAYRAVFRLQTTKASGSAREADNPVLRLDVYNGRVLVQREVSAEESGGPQRVSLDFFNDRTDRPLEFRVKVLRPAHVWVEGIEIEPQLGPSIAAYLAEVQIERSRVLFRQGRLGEALAALNEISPPLGGGSDWLLELARLYEATGKKSEAVGEYLRLLDLIPYHGEAISRIEGLGFSGVSTAARDRLLRRKEEISPQRMAEAVFGGRLQFLGWTVSPSSARPGEDVKVAYYWKCIEPLVRDADVFVHFESPGGGFQDDHRPRREDVGTGAWMKGEVVRYDRIVRIPPGAAMGRHAVYLGIWDPRGGGVREEVSRTTLPVRDRAVQIGFLEVVSPKP